MFILNFQTKQLNLGPMKRGGLSPDQTDPRFGWIGLSDQSQEVTAGHRQSQKKERGAVAAHGARSRTTV